MRRTCEILITTGLEQFWFRLNKASRKAELVISDETEPRFKGMEECGKLSIDSIATPYGRKYYVCAIHLDLIQWWLKDAQKCFDEHAEDI
jgi:hypothetical protein